MRVVRDRLRHRALLEAEALQEAHALRARGMVALKNDHLHNVLRRVRLHKAVPDRQIDQPLVVANAVGDDLDDARLDRAAGVRGRGDAEALLRDRMPDVHGIADARREAGGRDVYAHFSVFRHHVAVDDRARDADVTEVVKEHDVRTLARRDAAHLVIHAEAGGDVDRHILDRLDGVEPFLDGTADDVVQMPFVHERVGMRVVGDEAGEAVVNFVVEHGVDDDRHIVPRAAVAHECVHSVPHFFQRVLGAGGFVAAADAGGDVGAQCGAGIGDGKMPGDDVVGLERFGKLGVDMLLRADHVREAHHFAETHDAVPRHHFADVVRPDRRAGVLKARDRRDARRRVGHRLKRGALRVLDHELHAVLAADVADLVRVHENAGRAAGNDRLGVLAHGEHGRLHMDVPVHKAGRNVLPRRVDDLRVRTDAVRRVAHERDAPLCDGDVDALLNFRRADVDEPGAANDQLRRLRTHSDPRQRARHGIQRLFAELVQHNILLTHTDS